jgi:chromate transporter
MYIVGIFYRLHGDHAWTTAALKGVAAAAVGLVLSTVVQLSKKSMAGKFDFIFMALTVLAVNRLHQSVPRTLIVVGILATLFHRPSRAQKANRSFVRGTGSKDVLSVQRGRNLLRA